MGQLIVLPQLIQQLLFLHGGGHLLLLQPGDLAPDAQQLLVPALALSGGPGTHALQLQFLPVQLCHGVGTVPVLRLDGGQLRLLLPDGPGKVRVFGLVIRHAGLALVPVPGDAGLQFLQLAEAGPDGLPLRLQRGQGGVDLGHLPGDAGGPLLQVGLASGLALRLAFQGGGGPLQLPDAFPGALGVFLDLGGAALQLLQLGPLALLLALQIGRHTAAMGQQGFGLQNGVLPHPQLALGGLQLITGGGGLPLCLGQGPGGLRPLVPDAHDLLIEPLQLVGPAQDAGAAAGGAAGHGTAGVEHLAVQRDDAEFIAVLPGGGDGGVQVLHDGHTAQKVGKYVLISGVEGDQLIPHSHKAGLPGQALGLSQFPRADGADGQDGGAAPVPALQIVDDGLAVLLPVHHDVLHGPAQGGLDGHGVPVGHLQKVGHRAVDVFQPPPLGLSHDQLHRLGVALVDLLHLGEQLDPGGQGVFLHLQLHLAVLHLLRLFPAGFGPEAVAVDDVLGGVPLLHGVVVLLLGGADLLFRLVQPLLQFMGLPADGLVPVQHLLGGGGQGGQQGLGLGGVGGAQILPLPQLLQFPGQSARRAGGLLCLTALGGQLLPGALQLTLDLLQPPAALVDLGGQGVLPALLLLQVALQPLGRLQIVLDVAFQHGDGRLQLLGGRLPALHLKPEPVRLHVLLPHFLRVALGGGVGLLLGGPGFGLLAGGLLVVGLHLDGVGPDPLQTVQPDGDLQSPQLVPEDQILFGLLALLPQGLHLELQLGDLVVDPHQILVGALQLPLGLLLPVSVAGDAGGLLKDLPAVGGLDGQNFVDLALADDGVALPAQARVHEQLVDVLQPDGTAVDIVLALAGAVVPPGDHHLGLLHVEDMRGVVQHQRYLGVARLLALGGAAEDHVLHLAAPEGPGGLLPHDPADGVGDIGFAGPVGPHDGGDVLGEGQHRLVREGLEALDLQCF